MRHGSLVAIATICVVKRNRKVVLKERRKNRKLGYLKMPYRYLVNFWPLVPAIDLQDVIFTEKSPEKEENDAEENTSKSPVQENKGENEVNYLLVGSSIGCLIKTIARIGLHENKNINIYVADSLPESLTRCLLLLNTFCLTTDLSILERSEMFLEILGNLQIRFSTAEQLQQMSADLLIKVSSQEKYISPSPQISLWNLKQREIDDMVRVLSYLKDKNSTLDAEKVWDNALRYYFNQSYDHRENLFDYAFNVSFSDSKIINLKKYMDWRETGVAFKFRQAKYDVPNKSLHIEQRGTRNNLAKGDSFVGDIVTSPYFVFGVESTKKELFKKMNGEYAHTSEEISKENMIELLELYTSLKEDQLKRISVNLVFFEKLCKMRKFKNFFDGIYVTCDMMHCSNNLLPKFLKKGGTVVFETLRNVVNSKDDQKKKHSFDMDRLAGSSGLEGKEYREFTKSGNFKIYTFPV